jgi:hypothetical protein
MTGTRTALIIAAIAVGFALTACASTPSSTPPTAVTVTAQASTPPPSNSSAAPTPPSTTAPAAPASVGVAQTVTATDTTPGQQGDATSVVTVESAEWTTNAPPGSLPAENLYLVVDVSIAGVTGSTHYNPYDWTVRGADGREYKPGFDGAPKPRLSDGYAEPGDLARGYIAFDLPQGPATLILGKQPGVRWAITG